MKKFLLGCVLLLAVPVWAQVGINILTPDSSAVLQLESQQKGLGLPRLTTAQMNAIFQPLKGLTIYNTTDSVIEYWNGQCWLRAYEKNCYECRFNMTIDDVTDTLDRTDADSVFSTINILQTHGNQDINIIWSSLPPQGVNIYFNGPTTIDSVGAVSIVVKADIFAGSGNVPILVTAFCGDQIRFVTYNVYIKPCVRVTIPIDVNNYDLQAQNSSVLPAGAKECVVVTVNSGVSVSSNLPTATAYTSGNLNPLSIVGIVNNGSFLGRGGNGASGGSFSGFPPGAKGTDGGNALNLTTKTIIQNYGQIFAGGGGGSSVGLSTTVNIPLVGSLTFGFGVCGGGGSSAGTGGAPVGTSFPPGGFVAGQSATAGPSSVPGAGGSFSVPLSIPLVAGVTANITPNGAGGSGGAFGQAGGSAGIGVRIQACGIPIIGCVNLVNLGPFNYPQVSAPGLAIKRNGNPLSGIADGNYNSAQVKGAVTP
ncbi:MAG: hypothetical protein U0T84_03625 [Chitinophagales bacterium]